MFVRYEFSDIFEVSNYDDRTLAAFTYLKINLVNFALVSGI